MPVTPDYSLYFDRVRQTSSTIGTGTYTLTGSIAQYRDFSTAGGFSLPSFVVPYVAVFNADYEAGYGLFTVSGATLSRLVITSSSNGNAAVSWTAGDKTISLAPLGDSTLSHGRRNNITNAYPLAASDATQGYERGSMWVHRDTGQAYICDDATATAAKWTEFNSLKRNDSVSNGAGRGPGAYLLNADDYAFITADAQVRKDQTLSMTANAVGGRYPRASHFMQALATTDATPGSIPVPIFGGAVAITGDVVLSSGNLARLLTVQMLVRRDPVTPFAVTIVGTPTITSVFGDASLSTATLAASVSGFNISLDVTGIAATNITWSAHLRLTELYTVI